LDDGVHDDISAMRPALLVAIDFEKQVARALTELHPLAQMIRETVHDLDHREPNVTTADLEARLEHFVRELDRVLSVQCR
jgi:nucleotide-binding universal stress UspA family protein